MFDIDNIQYNSNTKQFLCSCQCNSSQDAEYICAKYIMIARTFDTVGELYNKGSIAIIGATSKKAAQTIASYINANYFMPPLDVYVFYGSSQKGLQSRWCIGFNHPNANRLTEALNTQGPLIIADRDSQTWKNRDGKSYSVVLLSGVLEPTLSPESEQRITLCLNAIQNVTARKINVHTVQ